MFAKSTVTQSMIDAVNKVLDKEIVLGEMLAEDANNPHQAAITHHHTELMKAHQVGNKEAIAHHADELNKAKDRFRTHRAANEPAHVPPKPGSIEHYYATARRTNDSVEIDTTGKEIVAEGLPQTLRKVVPGYAKREIDQKMDAGKFGKTDADKDANFQRYKKIQDKIKEQSVAEDAPFLAKAAGGLALGALGAAGAPAIVGLLGPILGTALAAYGAYNSAKGGMWAVDKLWDMAAKKLGGDNSAAEFAKAHMRAAAKGEGSFEFNGSTFKTELKPTEVPAAAKAVKQVSESKKRAVDLSASLNEFYETSVMEKIPANAPVDVWIQDFEKSTAPQFRGKNKAKRRQMAIAASYGAKNPKKKKK